MVDVSVVGYECCVMSESCFFVYHDTSIAWEENLNTRIIVR